MSLPRKAFLRLGAVGAALAAGYPRVDRAAGAGPASDQLGRRPGPDEVLGQLLAGNERFARAQPQTPRRRPEDFRAVAAGQSPLAVILGCADSRVSPELLFDMGIGDLFVVRVAGNVVSGAGPAVKGSVEYALAELEVPLVMVLGHTSCGAVKAALEHIDRRDALPGAINELVELIKPAVAAARTRPGPLLDNAIRANVALGVERLRGLRPILAPRIRDGRAKVVGGVYDLQTGRVSLVEGEKRA